jgi:hypothetical protein
MENLLIEIYLFVCQVHDTSSQTCYQRLSNNRAPEFTDQEIMTIWFFAHSEGCFEKKRMHRLILKYWREWFPRLPSYQTFVLRLNHLEPTFQTFGAVLAEALSARHTPELDHMVDSLPVMLARHGHSYGARVARDVANIGYCAAKKTRFHGVRLHCIAQRRAGRLPLPAQVWPVRRLAPRLESLYRAATDITRHRTLRRFSLPDAGDHLALERAGGAADCAAEEAEGHRTHSRRELLQPAGAAYPATHRESLQLDGGEDTDSKSKQSALK